MINKTELKPWLAKAEKDRIAVKLLLKSGAEIQDIITFHCQQSVEKYLKGFLAANHIDFPKTHDLDTIYRLCAQKDAAFKILDKGTLSDLTDYAVAARYPGEEYKLSAETLSVCVNMVKQVKLLVEKLTR